MSFVNPLFLIGGLALGIPILLHLIKREHAHKIEFPTLMFLRRISRKTIRYQKLRHLLLLLLRVLAFLLVVLAFMRPYRERPAAASAVGRVTTAHIIVLDNSLSMGYQDRWDRARKAAAGIVRNSAPDDKFLILGFSDMTVARSQFTSDPSDVLSQIESLELSDHATRYGQALRTAEKFAFDAGTGRRVLHLISDFQKNGWMTEDRDFRLQAGIDLQYVDVGSDDFSNLAFRDVHISETDQGGGNGIDIKSSVVNFGNVDRKNVRVSLLLDGRSVAEKRVDVVRGGSQGVDFQLPGLTSGAHPVVLEVDDPNLTRDNRFYMTVEARGKTSVLVVENSSGDRRSPSFFLAKALNVDTVSPYRMKAVSPQNLAITGGLLIWNNAPVSTAAALGKMQEFVKAGGGLAVIVADSLPPSDFNRTFGSWLPVKVEERANAQGLTGTRPIDNYVLMTDVRMDHPIFQPFNHPNSGSFSSARFFQHAKMTVGPGADVPARFDNGDPALVSVNVEKGRVLIFASSADDSWNDLPLKSVYAPFWQQVLHYLENFQERRHWLDVGETMAPRKLLADTALRQARGKVGLNESIVVLEPNKQRLPLAPGSDEVAVDWAGFYEVRSMSLSAPMAVNPIARESDLTHGNAEEMAAGWMTSRSAVFPQAERPAPEEQDHRQRIWSLLLIAAALFLLSELVLSNFRPAGDDRKEESGQPPVAGRPS